jgi:adenylylsulfate kinase-like enzyme
MSIDRLPVIWLTGNTGAGKTTLAFGIRDYCNNDLERCSSLYRRILVLDGDEMRATISVDEGLSPEDRRKHNLRVARLAALMSDHGFCVIVAVIAPFARVRSELDQICAPRWIYVKRSGLSGSDRPYEPPAHPDMVIDNDMLSIEEGRKQLKEYVISFSRNTEKSCAKKLFFV